mgnify:CR=1 FL=1
MYTININEEYSAYKITLNLESHVDGNGTVVAPYSNNSKIAQIEDIINEVEFFKEVDKPANKYINNEKVISTKEDVEEHFKRSPDKYFVEGTTDSKFTLLDLSLPKERAMNLEKENSPQTSNILIKNPNELDGESGSVTTTNVKPTDEIRCGKRIEISGTNIIGMILSESETLVKYVLYIDTKTPILYTENKSDGIDNIDNMTTFRYMRYNTDEEVKPTLNYYSDTIDEPKVLSEVFIERGVNNAFEPIKKLKNIKDLNELTKSGFGYYKINTKGYNFKDR